jgi:RNA polymerase sigma factor (sigma-70 family)
MSIDQASAGAEPRDAPVITKVDIGALYVQHHAILYAHACRALPARLHADARDALMTVFRRLSDQKEKGTLEEQPNWKAYLKTSVTNACLDIIKANPEKQELDPEDPQLHHRAPADPTGDAAVEAMSALEGRARAEAMLQILDEADARLRTIVVGKLFEERTDKDIGAKLGITGQRVGQLYRKALKMLQEEVTRTDDQ